VSRSAVEPRLTRGSGGGTTGQEWEGTAA
jgi:hypothetical protein